MRGPGGCGDLAAAVAARANKVTAPTKATCVPTCTLPPIAAHCRSALPSVTCFRSRHSIERQGTLHESRLYNYHPPVRVASPVVTKEVLPTKADPPIQNPRDLLVKAQRGSDRWDEEVEMEGSPEIVEAPQSAPPPARPPDESLCAAIQKCIPGSRYTMCVPKVGG